MGFKMGIVGLPNVGKSTLFNALTKTAAAQAANFPFCTIEPNVGEVAVPDPRLDILAKSAGSKQILPARMTFVDIAGLVKGASKGEGLGNQFLATIRECDAIAHVVRCFEDGDVTHVDGRVDPIEDAQTIETALMLADLESIEKRLQGLSRKVRGGDKDAVQQERLLKAAQEVLENGQPARTDEIAEDVWTGTAEIANELNQSMTARLPMAEAIADQPAGVYALTARVPGADPYDDPGATQWFVLTDLGISTGLGTDGLHVTVRGLHDATPREGIEVSLVSNANAVIAKAQTDASGYAQFEAGLTRGKGASAPALVMVADGDSDFSFLSLTDPAFDLSDRGVEGRAPAGPVDVFLTTDRGAYRAGEVIHITALSRDNTAQAIEGLPLTAILYRPDGVEYRRAVSDGGVAGGHVFSLPVAPDVPRGTWKIEIKSDPKADALARQTVLVEDFLPERIDFDLSLPDAPLRPGDTPPLQIDARYLFGAPGSGLSIDGQVIARPTDAVPGFETYRFGRYDAETSTKSTYFGDAQTDASGQASIAVEIPVLETNGKPLEAEVIARLTDGSGRPVERRLTAPVRSAQAMIGIRPLFEDVIPEGTEAAFQVIGPSPDLTAEPMRLRWTLKRLETHYQWYQLYGDWNWEPTTRRTRIATGEVETGTEPLNLSQPVDWGQYELVVERLDGAYAETAVEFSAGWYQAADASTAPDRVERSLDRDSDRPGDTAQLRIVPLMAGVAQIEVLSNRLIHRQMVDVPEGETVIPIDVTEDWGAGAYVTATVIRPMEVAAGQNPARAMGVAHATVEPVGRTLDVSIDVPQVTSPRTTQKALVRVENAPEGEPVWLTLAAVDVGILNLTGFESPDPQGYYFGQRRLGVDLRDVYGRLIDGMNGAMGTIRSGGDNSGMQRQSPPPTQDLMAVFSGPVQVDANGEVEVDILGAVQRAGHGACVEGAPGRGDAAGRGRQVALLQGDVGVGHIGAVAVDGGQDSGGAGARFAIGILKHVQPVERGRGDDAVDLIDQRLDIGLDLRPVDVLFLGGDDLAFDLGHQFGDRLGALARDAQCGLSQ